MRQYYASDKKRREEAKRKHQAEKRLKKLNKSQKSAPAGTEATPGAVPVQTDRQTSE